jgi:hypothetical protein
MHHVGKYFKFGTHSDAPHLWFSLSAYESRCHIPCFRLDYARIRLYLPRVLFSINKSAAETVRYEHWLFW